MGDQFKVDEAPAFYLMREATQGRFMIKAVVVILVVVTALLLLALAYFSASGSRKADVMELPVEWPPADELRARWCGSGSRSASLEAALLSCDGDCYALLRYWVFLPSNAELKKELTVEVREDGEVILERDVPFYKGSGDMYVHTPVLLLRMPEGATVTVANESIRISECSERELVPPQVMYTRARGRVGGGSALSNWKQPIEGLKYIRLTDGVYVLNWTGTAKLSCGTLSLSLRELGENELAIVSVKKGGCDVEIGGKRAHLEG